MTLGELLDAWLVDVQDRVDLAKGTVDNYLRISRLLREWGGEKSLNQVRLSSYVRMRRGMGIAERTIELELRVVTIAINWAKRAKLLGDGDQVNVPKLKLDPRKFSINHRTPSPGEAGRVIAGMDRGDWRLALLILARTGARVGEVVSLRSRDLDEREGTLVLGATVEESKTGIRVFPLDPHSLHELRGRSGRGDAPLFDFDGLKDPKQGLRRRLLAACLRAGVAPFSPHGLRRMVVGRLIRAGVDPGTSAAMTGHSVRVMLQHYQVVQDEDRRAAAEQAALGILRDS